ncbi:NPCBM/NEW2 domain-containing protein [Opitutus sp. GAS368]|uniref:NPCBM/NEW2 domain-containing protein n=1 Tax=Opitutus sp. GAS368 TaxID=1882749 RepID=UPI00087AC1D1|nr:NPCBM/NEW2 domain-containing protein [Opitutus sp. GAS368]SDS01531.1 alpha-galactosidase [Opitutus sp. GAS368]
MKRSFLLLLLAMARLSAETVPLAAVVNIRDADYEHARPVPDQSAKNSPLVIAGRAYPKGLGTQADNRTAVELNGATRFTAFAGVDDATESALPVHLEVQVDGQTAWQQEMKKGEAAAAIDLDVRGKKTLVLICRDLGNNYTQALADWADAQFTVEGDKPKSVFPPAIAEEYVILTPKAPAAPRLNGARVFGVRPGHPFFYQIPATGERPMKFSAEDLPAGLTLDAATGRITGAIAAPGTHRVTLRATNAHGTDTQPWRIEVGEKIALTPAMGWNSWNCWGVSVDQEKVLASARAIVAQGLVEHGWSYINIDDTWQGARPGPAHALQANGKFPDLKKFCDELHAMGLKAGIYSTPWITSYAGYPGGSADNPAGDWVKPPSPKQPNRKIKPWHLGDHSFAAVDAQQWAEWGIDYLKYDWNPNEAPETKEMADALRASGRDIVYSLSNNAPFANAAALAALANSWRTTGDIRDAWGNVRNIWSQQEKWREFAGPGHWNDPDMLVIGPVDVGSGRSIRPSRLTPNEQYTHITLWCLLSAPLLIGCPVEKADDFTLSLLTNDEVLAIDQDELGRPARQLIVDGRKQVYVKELADGSRAIGFFNLAQETQKISVTWAQLGLAQPARARDLWRQQDIILSGDGFVAGVPRHGTCLIRVWPAR